MEILFSVTGKVAEYIVKPIGRNVRYLISYKDNIRDLFDHVKELEAARDEIGDQLEEESSNGKIIIPSVQHWLESVDEVIAEANQLQNDPDYPKVRRSRWKLVSWHQQSRKATKMSKNVVLLLKILQEITQVTYPAALNFGSREPIKENIMHALRDPQLSMIGVYGLGGVGKTTFVREVVQIAVQEKLFDAVVMATVSKTPDIKIIQDQIAYTLGLLLEESVAGRASRICQRIKREKTILVILDDIWGKLNWELVGIPFAGKHNGCKLLMTSRSLVPLQQMGVEKCFSLEVINEEETWSLFKVMAGDVYEEPSLHQNAYQIAKSCAGLPVRITTVARMLRNQDIHAWKDALNQLEGIGDKDMQEITYSALELSYKKLQGNEMKTLFLLCATNGEKPLVSDLFKYGMGLGLFNNTNTMQGARDRFDNMISALKASCLLLDDDTSTRVKMHDIVREVAISIASRDHHVLTKIRDELKEFPSMDFLRRCSQISLFFCHIHELPQKLDCPNLKLFHLYSVDPSLEIPDFFFEGVQSLEVLGLIGMNLASLPASFRFLTSIKTLCLDQCVLGNMDAIGALKNLEILSLSHSSMIKFPSEIQKLTRLRMLDLSNSGIEVIPPNTISSLLRLEELYMGNAATKWKTQKDKMTMLALVSFVKCQT